MPINRVSLQHNEFSLSLFIKTFIIKLLLLIMIFIEMFEYKIEINNVYTRLVLWLNKMVMRSTVIAQYNLSIFLSGNPKNRLTSIKKKDLLEPLPNTGSSRHSIGDTNKSNNLSIDDTEQHFLNAQKTYLLQIKPYFCWIFHLAEHICTSFVISSSWVIRISCYTHSFYYKSWLRVD